MVDDEQVNQADISGLIEESAEELYEHAPCGYISTLPDGIIVRVNATFLNWVGFTREELLYRKRFQDLLTIGCKIYYETHFGPLLQMQGFVNEVNLDLQTSQKQPLPVLLNMVQVKSADGKPRVNRATLFNITDRKKYERELLLARKKAEEAAKAKADFLSTVSHEIRTPLNAIIGISNLLAEPLLPEKKNELVNILRFSANNLLHLINDILDFSKIEAGKITLQEKDFNLRELVMSTLYSLSVKAEEKNIQLHSQIDERLPAFVVGDATKIGQVLTNLVGNAIKFTDEGSVTVSVKVLDQNEEAADLKFAVTDTGIGIPADKLQQVFEEFTQASYDINTRYGGTGLGLSISRKLLQLHGSELQVISEEGKGSEFYFRLRLKIGKPVTDFVSPAGTKTPDNQKSLAGVRLLLAEDNEVNVFVLAQFLEKWGVEYAVAANGALAVEMVQRGDYQLVLMDLQMPVMDGYEASRIIRNLPDSRCAQLPIIALSASTKFDLEDRLQESQINDFIGKPFDPAQLHAMIAHYSGYRVQNPTGLSASEAKATAVSDADLDLEQYRYLTEGDPVARQELYSMTIRNLEEFRDLMQKAILQKDLTELRFQAHKIKMTLDMLKANSALTAIWKARQVVSQKSPEPGQLTLAQQDIADQLNRLISALQKELES